MRLRRGGLAWLPRAGCSFFFRGRCSLCFCLFSGARVLCLLCFLWLAGVSSVVALRGRRRLVCCGVFGRLVGLFVPRGGRVLAACCVRLRRFLAFRVLGFGGLLLVRLSCVFAGRASVGGGGRRLLCSFRCSGVFAVEGSGGSSFGAARFFFVLANTKNNKSGRERSRPQKKNQKRARTTAPAKKIQN